MAMKADRPLSSPEALWKATVEFLVLPSTQERAATSIYSDEYVAGTWVSFHTARETFPYPHPYLSEQYDQESKLPNYLFPSSSSASASKPNGYAAESATFDSGLSFDAFPCANDAHAALGSTGDCQQQAGMGQVPIDVRGDCRPDRIRAYTQGVYQGASALARARRHLVHRDAHQLPDRVHGACRRHT